MLRLQALGIIAQGSCDEMPLVVGRVFVYNNVFILFLKLNFAVQELLAPRQWHARRIILLFAVYPARTCESGYSAPDASLSSVYQASDMPSRVDSRRQAD